MLKKKYLLIFLETCFSSDKEITLNILYDDYVPKDDLATASHAFHSAKWAVSTPRLTQAVSCSWLLASLLPGPLLLSDLPEQAASSQEDTAIAQF